MRPFDLVSGDLAWLVSEPRRRRTWRYRKLLIILLGLFLTAAALTLWFTRASSSPEIFSVPVNDVQKQAVRTEGAIVDDPFAPSSLRALAPAQARAWNAVIPTDSGEIAPARAFLADISAGTSLTRSLDCLTAAIYYEAASESIDGQRAVAQVVLNRVRHPVYPHSICGVVFQGAEHPTGCQFTFACDGSLARQRIPSAWARARAVAAAALGGYVYAPVGWATHYHADYVVPYWSASLAKVAAIGSHIFYRWSGRWGNGKSFDARYAGLEPLPLWEEAKPTVMDLQGQQGPQLVAMHARPILSNVKPDAGGEKGSENGTPAARADDVQAAPKGRWVLAAPPTDHPASSVSTTRAILPDSGMGQLTERRQP